MKLAIYMDAADMAYISRIKRLIGEDVSGVVITKIPDYKFEIGKGVTLTKGNDVTIIATGMMVELALEAKEELAKDGINARVINIHTIKPIDKDLLINAAKETGAIVTAEEHSIIGGLGSAVAEVVTEEYPVPVLKVGIKDTFGESGKPAQLFAKYKIDADAIVEACTK